MTAADLDAPAVGFRMLNRLLNLFLRMPGAGYALTATQAID